MNVALLFGGMSKEHEISVRSARTVLAALKEAGHSVVCIGIDGWGRWWYFGSDFDSPVPIEHVTDGKGVGRHEVSLHVGKRGLYDVHTGECVEDHIDIVFPMLHGMGGEDGTIQGYLETIGVPYVGCDVQASVLCMNKALTKAMLPPDRVASYRAINIPHTYDVDYGMTAVQLGETLFVKPAKSGSSLGVSRVTCEEEFYTAIEAAFLHGNEIVIERAIVGREMECAVLETWDGIRVAGPGEIITPNGFYSYDEKYSETSATRIAIPADIDAQEAEKMRTIARETFGRLGCTGLARVDMFYAEGKVVVNEVNTMPGFTHISMYPKLFEHEGMSLRELVQHLLDNGMCHRTLIPNMSRI